MLILKNALSPLPVDLRKFAEVNAYDRERERIVDCDFAEAAASSMIEYLQEAEELIRCHVATKRIVRPSDLECLPTL